MTRTEYEYNIALRTGKYWHWSYIEKSPCNGTEDYPFIMRFVDSPPIISGNEARPYLLTDIISYIERQEKVILLCPIAFNPSHGPQLFSKPLSMSSLSEEEIDIYFKLSS